MHESPSHRSAPPAAPQRDRILVVDDDPDTRDALARWLCVDYDVVTAADGLEGLCRAAELPRPRLIVSDVAMPKLDGIAMIRRIREDPSLQRVPVIFLTAQTSTAAVVAGISAGARHYLPKPVDPYELGRLLRRALG